MRKYTLYKHTSPSGKVYIGITSQELKKRFGYNGSGYRKCPRFCKAIKKYGWKSFTHEVLREGMAKEEAEKAEIESIKNYRSNDPNYGYNIENGGNCAGTHSAETRFKISQANKGKKYSKETLETMSKAQKGKVGPANSFYGKTHTQKVKDAQAAFMRGNQFFKGHHHTEDFKTMKSKQMHELYKDGNNPRCKIVLQKDENGHIKRKFKSLRETVQITGISLWKMHKMVNDPEEKEWSYA